MSRLAAQHEEITTPRTQPPTADHTTLRSLPSRQQPRTTRPATCGHTVQPGSTPDTPPWPDPMIEPHPSTHRGHRRPTWRTTPRSWPRVSHNYFAQHRGCAGSARPPRTLPIHCGISMKQRPGPTHAQCRRCADRSRHPAELKAGQRSAITAVVGATRRPARRGGRTVKRSLQCLFPFVGVRVILPLGRDRCSTRPTSSTPWWRVG